MPQIGIADKQTLDNTKTVVDTVNTKIGVNTDVAGTTTVFARVRQIYEYMVNTLLTAINGRQASWGAVAGTKTNIDNTATNVNTINTNVNTINTKIGASTDTGTTTLFGLTKNSGTNLKKLYRASYNDSTDNQYTRLNISGSGYLMTVTSSQGCAINVRVDNSANRFLYNISTGTTATLLIRFETALHVTTNINNAFAPIVYYILD